MAAGDVPGLVRDHADQLVRRFRSQNQPGVHEDRLATGDEGVELIVLDQVDADIVRLEPGGAKDRGGHRADVVLDFGVADRAAGAKRRVRRSQEAQRGADGKPAQQTRERRCFHCPPPCPTRCRTNPAARYPAIAARARRGPTGRLAGRQEFTKRCHHPRRGFSGLSVIVCTLSAG